MKASSTLKGMQRRLVKRWDMAKACRNRGSLEIWMPPSYWHHQKVSNWLCASGNGFIDWSQLRFSSLLVPI